MAMPYGKWVPSDWGAGVDCLALAQRFKKKPQVLCFTIEQSADRRLECQEAFAEVSASFYVGMSMSMPFIKKYESTFWRIYEFVIGEIVKRV